MILQGVWPVIPSLIKTSSAPQRLRLLSCDWLTIKSSLGKNTSAAYGLMDYRLIKGMFFYRPPPPLIVSKLYQIYCHYLPLVTA